MQKLKFYFSQIIFFIFELLFTWTQNSTSLVFISTCFLSQFCEHFLTSLYFCKHFWPLLSWHVTSLPLHTLSPSLSLSLHKFSLIVILNQKVSWIEAQFWRGSSVVNSSGSVLLTCNRIKKKCKTVSYLLLQLAIAVIAPCLTL